MAVPGTALVVALATFGLAACGEGAPEAGDKKITVYSGRTESLIKPLLEPFRRTEERRVGKECEFRGSPYL